MKADQHEAILKYHPKKPNIYLLSLGVYPGGQSTSFLRLSSSSRASEPSGRKGEL